MGTQAYWPYGAQHGERRPKHKWIPIFYHYCYDFLARRQARRIWQGDQRRGCCEKNRKLWYTQWKTFSQSDHSRLRRDLVVMSRIRFVRFISTRVDTIAIYIHSVCIDLR